MESGEGRRKAGRGGEAAVTKEGTHTVATVRRGPVQSLAATEPADTAPSGF